MAYSFQFIRPNDFNKARTLTADRIPRMKKGRAPSPTLEESDDDISILNDEDEDDEEEERRWSWSIHAESANTTK